MSMSPKSSAFTDLVTNYMASLPLSCLVTVLVVVSLPVLCPVWGGGGTVHSTSLGAPEPPGFFKSSHRCAMSWNPPPL